MLTEFVMVEQHVLEARLLAQRPRLVRLCAQLAGQVDAADDLAQEALLAAWQHIHTLRDPAALDAWVNGIARNVCMRWRRRQSRELRAPDRVGDSDVDVVAQLPADVDLEVELERDELAELLDRALALLPADTRAVLIQKYIEETSHAEIAARLGLSEGAVAMRLQRGKLALRHILATDLRAEAAIYGLADESGGSWKELRLWCPLCGQQRLRGRPYTADHGFALECPGCSTLPGGMTIAFDQLDAVAGITSIKAAFSRLCVWSEAHYSAAIRQRTSACLRCGAPVPVRMGVPPYAVAVHGSTYALNLSCAKCHAATYSSLNGLILNIPALRRFWRQHARMRLRPTQEIVTVDGSVLVTRVENLTDTAQFDVVHRAETLELLHIHGA